MALTTAQSTTLAAHIRASTDGDVIAALAIRNDTEMARLYNLETAFVAWKPSVTVDEIGMAFDYAEVANKTSGDNERLQVFRAYNTDSVDPSRLDIRDFFDDVFSAAGGVNTRAALAILWTRFVTVTEEIFTTGTGTQGDPGTLDFVGTVSSTDIGQALNNNP